MFIFSNFSPNKYTHPAVTTQLVRFLSPLLYGLDDDYPNFVGWLNHTVLTGLATGQRSFLYATYKGRPAGVAILKRTPHESKICTLKVAASLHRQSIGSELMRKSFSYLGTQLPLITVSTRKIDQLAPLLERFSFVHTDTIPNAYVFGQEELIFNSNVSLVH